jgi:hypothetical protein
MSRNSSPSFAVRGFDIRNIRAHLWRMRFNCNDLQKHAKQIGEQYRLRLYTDPVFDLKAWQIGCRGRLNFRGAQLDIHLLWIQLLVFNVTRSRWLVQRPFFVISLYRGFRTKNLYPAIYVGGECLAAIPLITPQCGA